MLAADTLEALGVPRGQYRVKISNRKLVDGLMEAIPELKRVSYAKRLKVLRSIDKLDRLGVEGVHALLGRGRRDESGDFTEGAGLSEKANSEVLAFLTGVAGKGEAGTITGSSPHFAGVEAKGGVGTIGSDSGETGSGKLVIGGPKRQLYPDVGIYQDAWDELEGLLSLVTSAGYEDRVVFDQSVVRGLEYYTGPVFEAELTAPIKDERGQPIRLGSVVSGGRYDGLVERFTGEKVPATGVSIGVSRLLFGLQRLGKYKAGAAQGPVVILVFPDQPMENYQRLAQRLRHPDDGGDPIRAEVYLGSGKIGAQTKYADRRSSPCVVIQGGDERAEGEVTIKDLILGATLTETKDRDEYLKKQAEAQFSVPESDLVNAVRRVLARHKA
ncbi:MAG: ATP phosphoribosyltransferase regulatory subunit [Methyloceanibacter sp.]